MVERVDFVENDVTKPPRIFLSHDTRDADIAKAFSDLLIDVSVGVLQAFRSSDHQGTQGIQFGVEWFGKIMNELHAATDVVSILTRTSLGRPWILFEAGVAKGRGIPLYGVALGIPLTEVSGVGPFGQFQISESDDESLTKLILQLLQRVPHSNPVRESILQRIRGFTEQVAPWIASTSPDDLRESDASHMARLAEEIKAMFQQETTRGMTVSKTDRREARPWLLEELLFLQDGNAFDPTGLLVTAGYFHDDALWLYELLLDGYRQLSTGSSPIPTIERTWQQCRNAFQRLASSPLANPGIHPIEFNMLETYFKRFAAAHAEQPKERDAEHLG